MIKISCEICMDLIPLVRDGIASPESTEAVREHLSHCAQCRALYDGEPIPDPKPGLRTLRRQLRLLAAMVIMFGMFLGLSLSGDGALFYNVLLMPAIGAVGYWLFRWKAIWQLPVLLFVTHTALNSLGLIWQNEHLDFISLLMWSAIFSGFSALGTVIAGLMHFALRKEPKNEKDA